MKRNQQMIDQSNELFDAVSKLLSGKPPQVIGMVLADLTGLWLVGHHESLRAGLLNRQIEYTNEMLAFYLDKIKAEGLDLEIGV